MRPCPSQESLANFLTHPNGEFAEHVNTCHHCQMILEQLTGDVIAPPCPAIATEAGLQKAIAALTSTSIPRLDQALLGPPTRPGDLGMLGPYNVEAEIGRGGMGVVYRAFDSALNRIVALKVLRFLPDDNDLRRFQREAQAAAQLRHDNIVQIYAAERTKTGIPYLVLEYVNGPSLSQLVSTQGALNAIQAAELLNQAASGVETANRQGLIHRDIKPANILLDVFDPKLAKVKVSDFGLVRHENSEQTSAHLAGTPSYMSPEQARQGATIDARTDVYGLGATLYEALTGEPPFRGPTAGVIQQVLHDDPRPPRRLNPQVPHDLEVICLKAIAKEPGRRYASAADLSDDLQRWMNHEPISARPPGHVEHLRIWSRRNPRLAAVTVALIVAIALGIAGVTWQWRLATRQRDVAREHLRDAMRAVDHFYTTISEPAAALDKPGLQPLRRQLLQQAQQAYQDFLNTWPDDPILKVDAARAAKSLAQITSEIGTDDEIIAAWDRAAGAFSALAAEQPEETKWSDELYACRFHQANGLMNAGRIAEAEKSFQTVLSIVAKRAGEAASTLKYRRDHASCSGSLGNCALRQEKYAEARSHYERAAKLYRSLLIDDRTNPDLNIKLATTLTNLAMTLPALEQLPVYDEAKSTLMAIQVDPPDPLLVRRLAKIEFSAGNTAKTLNQIAEARTHWRTGIAALSPIVEANPAVTDYRWLLGQLHQSLGSNVESLEESLEHLQLASHHFHRLHSDDPKNASYRTDFAQVTAKIIIISFRLEQHQQADAMIAQLIAIPHSTDSYVVTAKELSLLGTTESCQRALILLLAARKAGANPKPWKTEPAFESLRRIREFTELMSR